MEQSGLQLHIASGNRSAAPAVLFLTLALAAALCLTVHDLTQTPLWTGPLCISGTVVLALWCLRKRRFVCCAAAALAALALLACLLPGVRDGAAILCAHLFSASEAVNRYTYIRFDSLPEGQEALRCMGIFQLVLAVCWGSFAFLAVHGQKWFALALTALVVGVEVYFGLFPSGWNGMVLFLLLALALLPRASLSGQVGVLLASLLVCFAVGTAFSGVNADLENCSEQLRDQLSETAQTGSAWVSQALGANRTHKENRLDAAEGAVQSENAAQYEKETEYQQEISQPRSVNYRKIILLLLAVVLLLAVPFVPFFLLDSRRRKALAYRSEFGSADGSAAVRVMFPHIVRCLTAFGLQDDNDDFSMLDLSSLPSAYVQMYREAVGAWQQAEYSDHPVSTRQKSAVAALLQETERFVYDAADRRQRFRLRYLDCLIFPEDER